MEGPIGLVDVGPYRATRLWLDLVQIFVTGIPLKRHWRNFKVVENCFTGREAVKWFHAALLQSTKASKLYCFTRSQTESLLEKFFHAGVFTSVSGNYSVKFRVASMDLYKLSAEAMNGGTLQLPFAQNIQKPPCNHAVDEGCKENQIASTNKNPVITTATYNRGVKDDCPRAGWPPSPLHHNKGRGKEEPTLKNTYADYAPIIGGAKPRVLGVLAPRVPANPSKAMSYETARSRQSAVARSSPDSTKGHHRSCSTGPIIIYDRNDDRKTRKHQIRCEPHKGPWVLGHIEKPPQHFQQTRRCADPEIRSDVAMHVSLAVKLPRDNENILLRQKKSEGMVLGRGPSRWRDTTELTHKRETSYEVEVFNRVETMDQSPCEEQNAARTNHQCIISPRSVRGTSLSQSTRSIARSAASLLPSPSVESISPNLFANSGEKFAKSNDSRDEDFLDTAWKNAFKSRLLQLFPGSLLASLTPSLMPAAWIKPGDEIRGNFVTLLETLFDVQRQGNYLCPDELSDKLCKSVIAHFTALAHFYSFSSDIYHLLHQGFIILQHLDEKTYQLKSDTSGLINPRKLSVVCLPNDFSAKQSNSVNSLPPNTCFETEFLSASPVTRIIAVNSLRRGTSKKSLFDFEEDTKRKSIAPSLRRRNSLQRFPSTKRNSYNNADRFHNVAGGNINPALETNTDIIPNLDYVAAMGCLQKLLECSRKDTKQVDLALLKCRRWDSGEMEEKDIIFESKDISGDGFSDHQRSVSKQKWENHDYVNVGFCMSDSGSEGSDGYDAGDSGTESEGASFHTAVCSPSVNNTQLSICVDDTWLGHVDATAVKFVQLVLLCVDPQRRGHLKQLLLALKVVSPSTKSLAKIVEFLSGTLTTDSSIEVDIDFMKRLLNFMVAHQSVLFDIPEGLLQQIKQTASFLKGQLAPSTVSLPQRFPKTVEPSSNFVNLWEAPSTLSLPPSLSTQIESRRNLVKHPQPASIASLPTRLPLRNGSSTSAMNHQQAKASTVSLPARLTRNNSEGQISYCTQVSTEQFEQQKLTVSQMAIAELLEQMLNDCKMSVKEKKKRLKMFRESYPHIYYRRFPMPERIEKKRLLQPVLTKFRSMRI